VIQVCDSDDYEKKRKKVTLDGNYQENIRNACLRLCRCSRGGRDIARGHDLAAVSPMNAIGKEYAPQLAVYPENVRDNKAVSAVSAIARVWWLRGRSARKEGL